MPFKTLVAFFTFCFALTTCNWAIAQTSLSDVGEPSEFYMSYQVNGKKVSFNNAAVIMRNGDSAFQIEGASEVQGDTNTIVILKNPGPFPVRNYSTAEGGIAFTLGGEDGVWSTLDLMSSSFGIGMLTVSEITETYAKGTFSFDANVGGEDVPRTAHDVTNGIFKAQIRRY